MNEANQTPACGMHEALMAYLYKEATADDARRFEAHLEACAACRQELADFECVRQQLQQWQVVDLPIVRVVADPQPAKRSFLAVLKELFTVMPVWVKVASVAAVALIVMAVTGTSISIGRDGFAINTRMVGTRQASEGGTVVKPPTSAYVSAEQLEQLRANLTALVAQKIADSERQQKEALKAELVSLQGDLQNMRSADLAKISARVQEHQARLQTIERDLDRREGSDLTDLLFSELLNKPTRPAGSTPGGD
ncbi:MAG TPA: zf-HC2 domain-containing protein [Blastocatellia bacterium]|nr:zf-HC2 domain-containing protein [Blastocatellia bacterium]